MPISSRALSRRASTRTVSYTHLVSHKAAEVLVEALPWIKNITGKTVVIKYGGSAMVDEQLRADVMNDIVLLKIVGVNPVIVHGGGKAITEAMDFLQLPVEFKDGQRVTTPEAMDLVRTVLMGKVNQELVAVSYTHLDVYKRQVRDGAHIVVHDDLLQLDAQLTRAAEGFDAAFEVADDGVDVAFACRLPLPGCGCFIHVASS